MIISSISIKNFKSFGNSEQVLELDTNNGSLLLLMGENGAGKTSLLSSIDFCLYGKCSGSKKKWATQSTLVNRINKSDTAVSVEFKSNDTDIKVTRTISPNNLELWENGVLNERAGKTNIDSEIEKYVDMDIDTFKSFISMRVDQFKNFISLTNEEKKLLLDKLFNLEIINILDKILKELVRNNKTRMTSLDSEISTLNESIESIQKSIQRSMVREKANTQRDIDDLKFDMESKKDEYNRLKIKTQKVRDKESEIETELDSEKRQYIITQGDIKSTQRDIDLYDSGKCPTCATPFDSAHFVTLRETLVEKKEGFTSIKNELESNIKKVRDQKEKLREVSRNVDKAFNDITFFLRNCKQQIDKLEKKRKSEEGINENVSEFEVTITELEEKKEVSADSMSISKEKEIYYKELNGIFGEDGVKKSIIAGIIKPINVFIKENINKMNMNFEVELDKTFTAEIRSLGNVIDPDTLSTGETKLTNVAILVAYLKLIRTKRHINILFLDEVFSSIDIENVQKMLVLLRSFANETKINIFVVHHAIMNNEMFDRILRIEKDIFSRIIEVGQSENYL